MTVLQLTLKLVIFIAVGFTARKLRVMPDGFDRMLTRFVMAIPLPCMIINSFNVEFSMQDLINCPLLLALAVGSMAAQFVIAQLIYIKMGRTGVARSARFALLFTNFTFFGLPVVSELYGAQGVFYYVIFTLPIRVIFYGGAPLTLGEPGQKLDVRQVLKKFICEPVVAVFIGFFLYVTQLPLAAGAYPVRGDNRGREAKRSFEIPLCAVGHGAALAGYTGGDDGYFSAVGRGA